MTQDAKPLTAEELEHLREIRVCCCEPGCTVGPHCVAPVLDGIGADWINDHFDSILAAIDQQAKRLACVECGDLKGFAVFCDDCWSHYYRSMADVTIAAPGDETLIAAFGSAVLRHILADTSFFESEESEQWCELLERHGYVERGIWDSAKHGESGVLGDSDEAWIFTEKMRRDAAGPSAAPSDERPTIAYWRRNAHEALDKVLNEQVAARLANAGETLAYLSAKSELELMSQQVVNHIVNARLAAARSEKA